MTSFSYFRARMPNAVVNHRLPQLDILRGVAILLVIGRHMYLQPQDSGALQPYIRYWFELGWTGVDLFFVLSGFLVGGLLMKEWKSRSTLDVKRFLIRRGYKIWPPYFICIIFTTIWLIATNEPAALRKILFLMAPNFLHLQSYVLTPLPHTWSLAIEEHFYLALPLIILLAAKYWDDWWKLLLTWLIIGVVLMQILFGIRFALQLWAPPEAMYPEQRLYLLPYLNPKFLIFFGAQVLSLIAVCLFIPLLKKLESERLGALPLIAVSVMILCLIFRVWTAQLAPQIQTDWSFTFFASHLRIDSLFFGVLLGYCYHFRPNWLEKIARYKVLLFIVGAFIAGYYVLFPIPGPLSQTVFTLLYLGYGLIFLATFYSGIGRSWPAQMLAFIGYYSYSIYLWHVNPARYWLEKKFIDWLTPQVSIETRWLIATSVYVVVIILFGALMAKLIETPSLKLRDRLFPSKEGKITKQTKRNETDEKIFG